MRIILSVLVILSLAACNGGPATDAGIDAIDSVVSQDNGPIGPDVPVDAGIDASDVVGQ